MMKKGLNGRENRMVRSIRLDSDIEGVIAACRRALDDLGWRLDRIGERKVVASTRASLRSWGETITVTLEEIDRYRTRVEVESGPRAQFFDWGKSVDNEERLIRSIRQELGE